MSGPLYYDRVQETSTTTGTGTLTLAGAIAGYQAWSKVGDGNTGYYGLVAVDGSGVPTGDWEVGLGTYTLAGTTLARTTVLDSSNSGSLVALAAGTKRVFLVDPAAVIQRLADGVVALRTADPASPVNDTAWIVREGTSPTMTVSVKARIGGTTYTIASITL